MNRHRTILWIVDAIICVLLILATILIGVYVPNKIAVTLMAIYTVYMIHVMTAWWIYSSKIRTRATKTAWIFAFLIFPVISIFIYFLWGRTPYHHGNSIDEYKKRYKKYLKTYPQNYLHPTDSVLFNNLSRYAKYSRGMNVTSDNSINILREAKDFYFQTYKAIDSAKEYIFMEYYIVADGIVWDTISDKLIEKANQGVKVYFFFDRYGCTGRFKPKMLAKLASHPNIQVAKFESDKDIKGRSTNNFRSHKKVLIIDNKLAIYGGSNLGDEYANVHFDFPNWFDLNMIVKGPIVKTMLIDFCMDWDVNGRIPYIFQLSDYKNSYKFFKPFLWIKSWLPTSGLDHSTLEKINASRKVTHKLFDHLNGIHYFDDNEDHSNENLSLYIPTGPRFDNNIMGDVMGQLFSNAKKTIKIITPYFYLTDDLIAALITAARCGISIDLITPGSYDDKWWVLDMNRKSYAKLMENGINVYEYSGFIHSKLIIVDDLITATGTYNLDLRSLWSNYESILVSYNQNLSIQADDYFKSCLYNAKKIDPQYLHQLTNMRAKVVQVCLDILRPLL